MPTWSNAGSLPPGSLPRNISAKSSAIAIFGPSPSFLEENENPTPTPRRWRNMKLSRSQPSTKLGTPSTAVSTSETASGWQTVQFSTPVPITANTVYIISWQTSFFYYVNRYFVSITHDKGPLHTPGVYEPSNGSCNHTDTWPKDTQGR